MENRWHAVKVCFILSALLFISIPHAILAADTPPPKEDNTATGSQWTGVPFSKNFFTRVIKNAEEEAKKRIQWEQSYPLLKQYLELGYPNGPQPPIMDEKWLAGAHDGIRERLKQSLLFAGELELKKLRVIIRVGDAYKGMTSFKVKKTPAQENFEFVTPSWNNKLTDIERELEIKEKELRYIGDVASGEGFARKIRLEQEVQKLKFELNNNYFFRMNFSANASLPKEGREAHITPFVNMSIRNTQMRIQYRLQTHSDNTASDIVVSLSHKLSPTTELKAEREFLEKRWKFEAYKAFPSATLQGTLLMNEADRSYDLTVTGTAAINHNTHASVVFIDSNPPEAPHQFSIQCLLNYKF